MKAILEFNLPDDQYDFKCANLGFQYRMALEEMDQFLRSTYKYGDDAKLADAAYEFRNKLSEITNERGIDIYSD